MYSLNIPKQYKSLLDVAQTEKAIKQVKDFFQLNLSTELQLQRVTAPMIVKRGTGINDDLNGIEHPVSFESPSIGESSIEIVHSLAKWKRLKLSMMKTESGYGIYTDMNALRPDEYLSNIHSIYVDQWDWEKVMRVDQRRLDYLKQTVKKIYEVMKRTEFYLFDLYPQISPTLPEEITFIHSEDLLKEYPDKLPRDRESMAAKKYGAIFIIGIGNRLKNGETHDDRAPDYDDWTTQTVNGYAGLNGDIILWNDVLQSAFEISSMGIRVDKSSMEKQLKITKKEERKELLFHKKLLTDELPQTIGGGIGQSRLCMYFLRKAHIGEVQSSLWPDKMIEECESVGLELL